MVGLRGPTAGGAHLPLDQNLGAILDTFANTFHTLKRQAAARLFIAYAEGRNACPALDTDPAPLGFSEPSIDYQDTYGAVEPFRRFSCICGLRSGHAQITTQQCYAAPAGGLPRNSYRHPLYFTTMLLGAARPVQQDHLPISLLPSGDVPVLRTGDERSDSSVATGKSARIDTHATTQHAFRRPPMTLP